MPCSLPLSLSKLAAAAYHTVPPRSGVLILGTVLGVALRLSGDLPTNYFHQPPHPNQPTHDPLLPY